MGINMNHKKLEILMAVLLIAGVYITVNRILPLASPKSEKRVVVLDAGHGGSDSGKISVTGTLEKDLNLSIVKKLQVMLEDADYEVILTRTDENGLYSETDRNRKIADMKKRCQIINESNADIVVSIHLNSFTDPKVNGAQVFYYKHSAEGKILASCIQESFKNNLNPDNKRVEKYNDSYYMLLNTKLPTVIAECGFLSNEEEAALVDTEEYREKIARAVFEGIENYYQKGQ
ncbi:MAG: N-acetylmuramoyl-L-alanine amidase [Bacteroides sp.]